MTNTSPQKLLGEKKPDGLRKVPTGDIAKTPLHPGLFVEHSTSRRLGDDVAMALAHVTGGGLLKRMNVTRRFACWHQTPHLTGPAIALWPPSLLVLPQPGPGPGEELMSWRTSAVANSRASASSGICGRQAFSPIVLLSAAGLVEQRIRLMSQPQPGQLDHRCPQPRVSRFGDPLFAVGHPTLPWCRRKSGVSANLSPVVKVTE